MNMNFHAWARGLLLSSLALTGVKAHAVVIGGIDFADNAFADRVLSTDFTGGLRGGCGATPVTIDDAVTGLSFDTWARYGDHDMFAGADGDYNSPVGTASPTRYLELGFVDNVIVNHDGPDLAVFEQGSPPNALRIGRDKFSIQNPYAPGAKSVVVVTRGLGPTEYCINPNMGLVDLSDLGFTNGERVYRIFVSSALLENGDVAWNNPVNPSWGVPEIVAFAAVHSENKGNYPPEVNIIRDDVTVSLPHALSLKLTDADVEDDRSWHILDVIDDSTPNASLNYAWTQTDGLAATISPTNTLGTSITFPEPGNYTFRLTVTDGSSASAYDTLNVQVTAADNTAPSTPANFAAEVLSNTGVSLTWTASTDDVAIKHYNIYRDNVLLTRTSNLFYKDFRVEPGEDYSYLIQAVDPAGNSSSSTAVAEVTLSARLFSRRVADLADNAEEHADGVVDIGDGDLELVEDGAFGAQTVGLRFQNITVPARATIVKAWLDFQADETSAEDTSLTIRGINDPDPVPFSAIPNDVSNRPVTSASVAWNNIPAWSAVGEIHAAPDMAAVVQELIGNGGWASGQAMSFVITGTGRRVAEARDNGANDAPRLFIEYQDPEPENQPPVVSAGADQEIVLPTNLVSLEGSVTDDNLTGVLTLTWSMQSGTGTVTFSAPDATATDATFSLAGEYVLRLTADDGELTHYDEVAVTVAPQPNLAPLVNVGADRSVSIEPTLELVAVVTDDGISGEAVTYHWEQVSGPVPGGASFAPDNAVETSVTFSQVGTYVLRLTADDGPLVGSDELTVVVSAPDNDPPSQPNNLTLDEIAIGTVEATWTASTDNVGVVAYRLYRDDVQIAEVNDTEYLDTGLVSGTTYTYTVIALDVENESEPSLAQSITTETVPDDAPEQTISLIRSDGAEQAQNGAMSIGSWPIDLGSLNAAVGLRFNNIEAPSGALISRAYLRFCARYSGSAPTSLNIAALNEADADVFVAESGHLTGRTTVGNVSWTNATAWTEGQCYESADIRSLVQSIVNMDDWRAGNSMGFIITGNGDRKAYYGGTTNALTNAPQLFLEYFDGNEAPVVNAGGTANVRLPTALSLNGSASDDSDDTLTYRWSSVTVPRGGVVTFDDATLAATNSRFNIAGNYTLRLTVSDGEMTGTADLAVTVLPVNVAPVVNAGADQAVMRPNTVTLTGTATDRDGPSALTYQWSKVGGPDAAVSFSAAQSLSTVATFSANGVYDLQLTVSDSVNTSSDVVSVEVTSPPNEEPNIEVGANRQISLPNTLSLTATMIDDGINGTPTLAWSTVSGPGDATFNPSNALSTSVTFPLLPGTYVLRLTAVDGTHTVTDDVSVVVYPPDLEAPTVPQDLRLVQSGTMVGIRWSAATDNVSVAGYKIYKDGALLTQISGLAHTDSGLTVSAEYDYQVAAVDASGNESAPSAMQSITIASGTAAVTTRNITLLEENGVEQAQNGTMLRGNYPIDLVYTTVGGAGNQTVGLRFTNINVPPGAFISRAYLSFCALHTDSGDASLNIAAIDEANVTAFLDSQNHLTGRATIGNVAWDVPEWTTGACDNRSPDIRELTQQIVDKDAWHAGYSMGFVITGEGSRRAYRGSTTNAPVLHIEYFGVVNQAPVVSLGADQTLTLPTNTLELTADINDPDSVGWNLTWERVSGPNLSSSAGTAMNQRRLTFTTAGTYVIRVTVNDGELSRSDDITITVNAAPGGDPGTPSDGGSSGGGGGGGSLDLWSLLALLLAGGIRFGSVRVGRRRLSGGCTR